MIGFVLGAIIGFVCGATVGVFLLADVEVDAVVILQEDADGADARLVFVGGREEIGAGFFKEISDFVDGVHFLQMLNFEIAEASRARNGVQ